MTVIPTHVWQEACGTRTELEHAHLVHIAARYNLPVTEVYAQACEAGVWPVRYCRNGSSLTLAEQARLLRSTVCIVGLGGLGGTVLELLARAGVGHLYGIDGDFFDETNTNRQLLACSETLHHPKAVVAAQRVLAVNPSVTFTPVAQFLTPETLQQYVTMADVIVDALGGMPLRLALHTAAQGAATPLVAAGIAGFTGWVGVCMPQQPDPAYNICMSKACGETAPEEQLGILSATAAFAASVQCAEVIKILTSRLPMQELFVFDLERADMQKVSCCFRV